MAKVNTKTIEIKSKKRYLKDLIKNNVRVSKPNMVWEVDIFYFPKKNNNINIKRQAYLSIVDSFSRYCIGVANISSDQSAEHIIVIIENTLKLSKIKPAIIHTDFGVQFSSKSWYLYSIELSKTFNTLVSLGNKNQYNTYATNYCIRDCRQNYLYNVEVNIHSPQAADNLIFESIVKYNNSTKLLFNDSPINVYNNTILEKIKPFITNKVTVPYKAEQEYIENVFELIKTKKLDNDSLENLNTLEIETFAKKFINHYINRINKSNHKKIPKRKRDLILELEAIYMLNQKEIFLLKSGNIYKAKLWIFLQIKICIALLYLTGCRISEITSITFKDLTNILKEGCVRLWISKDKTQRIIYLNNKKFLKHLDLNFNLLKNFCVNNNIVYSFENSIFFKLKKVGKIYQALNSAPKSTMKEILNNSLNYLTTFKFEFQNKAWSTHSFRHSLITKLIDKVGIEKTAEFIGHRSIATTQLYYNKTVKQQLLKKISMDI